MFNSVTKVTVLVFLLGVQLAAFGDEILPPTPELSVDQLSFDYMSSGSGGFWYDCTAKKDREPHDFLVQCKDHTFRVHLLVRTWLPGKETAPGHPRFETTYEMHYWADRLAQGANDKMKSSTQSTWITVDNKALVKKVLGYIGFDDDSTQVRLEVKF